MSVSLILVYTVCVSYIIVGEKIENIKGVIRSRKPKNDGQYNDQQKKYRQTMKKILYRKLKLGQQESNKKKEK